MGNSDRYSPNNISIDEVWASLSEAKRILWKAYYDKCIAITKNKYLGAYEDYHARRQKYITQEVSKSIIVPKDSNGNYPKMTGWIIVTSDGSHHAFLDVFNSFSENEDYALRTVIHKDSISIMLKTFNSAHISDDSKNQFRSYAKSIFKKYS